MDLICNNSVEEFVKHKFMQEIINMSIVQDIIFHLQCSKCRFTIKKKVNDHFNEY